jgi:uncharacterized protein YggE
MFKDKFNTLAFLGSVGLICLTLLGIAFFFSQTNFYIKDLSSSTTKDGKLVNSISVSGDGKVYAKPDLANISIGLSKTASTSSEALQQLTAEAEKARDTLTKNGVKPEDIQTTSLNLYPQYDYSPSGEPKLRGQQASQSLTFKVRGIDDRASQPSKILDELSKQSGLTINAISFDLDNKADLFKQAREQAFQKAESKAKELAGVSNLKLLHPVSIVDQTYDITPAPAPYNVNTLAATDSARTGGGGISSGQLEITVHLQVEFGIE